MKKYNIQLIIAALFALCSCSDDIDSSLYNISLDPPMVVTGAPTTLDFGTNVTEIQLVISNQSDAEVDWTATADKDWIVLESTKGTTPARETQSIKVTVNRYSLNNGTHEGTIRLKSKDSDQSIPVTLTNNYLVVCRPTTLGFDESESRMQLTIATRHDSDVNWQLSTTDGWITMSDTEGVITPEDIIHTVEVTINRDALGSGSHTGYINLTAGETTQRIPVTLTNASATMATVQTMAVSGITSATSQVMGNISSMGYGGNSITQHGHVCSTDHNPTIGSNTTMTQLGVRDSTGTFESSLTGLMPNTTYYVRAYATNSVGTAYGEEVTFTTSVATMDIQKDDFDDYDQW